jgi:hypothetical protein
MASKEGRNDSLQLAQLWNHTERQRNGRRKTMGEAQKQTLNLPCSGMMDENIQA